MPINALNNFPAGVTVVLAVVFILDYTRYADWWRTSIGAREVLLSLCLAVAGVIEFLDTPDGLEISYTKAAIWTVIAAVVALAIVQLERAQHRPQHKERNRK